MNQNCAPGEKTPANAFSRMIDYVERNRSQPVALEDIADAGGLSPFQAIRLFSRLTGQTPVEYARARRLAGSLEQLLRGERVIDVALDWGFEHEQSYIRAFKSAWGVTQARFRKSGAAVPVVEPPRITGFTVSASGMLGRPKRLVSPPVRLSGEVRRYNYAENLLEGTPLREGTAALSGDEYVATCRVSPENRFTHEYLIAGDHGADSWEWPAGEWVEFDYVGLHPLDGEGCHRVRILASLVIDSWFSERHRRWDGRFIERTRREWVGENACELSIRCPL